MKIFPVKLPLALGALATIASFNAFSNSIVNPHNISAQDRVLVNQLRTCIEAAIGHGLSTNEQVTRHCRKEVDALNNAVAGLTKMIVKSALDRTSSD